MTHGITSRDEGSDLDHRRVALGVIDKPAAKPEDKAKRGPRDQAKAKPDPKASRDQRMQEK